MHRSERRRDDGFRGSQELDEDVARIQVAQARGLDDTAQDLLSLGAAWRAIATGHLPILYPLSSLRYKILLWSSPTPACWPFSMAVVMLVWRSA